MIQLPEKKIASPEELLPLAHYVGDNCLSRLTALYRRTRHEFLGLLLTQALSDAAEKRLLDLYHLPQPSQYYPGELLMGLIVNGLQPYYLTTQSHITTLWGRTGTGKTTEVFLLLLQLYHLGIPFVVFEQKSGEYDVLAAKLPGILTLEPGDDPRNIIAGSQLLRMNAFTFNTYWKIHKQLFIDGFADLGLRQDGALHKLVLWLDEFLKAKQIDENFSSECWPTLSDLIDWIEKTPVSRNSPDYPLKYRLLSRLKLVLNELALSVNSQVDYSHRLFSLPIIVKLGTLSSPTKRLACFQRISDAILTRAAIGELETNNFPVFIIMDEVGSLLPNKDASQQIINAIRLSRSYNVHFIFSGHTPSSVAPDLLDLSSVTVTFAQNSLRDAHHLAELIGLPKDRYNLPSQLPPRTMLIKDNRYDTPLLVAAPHWSIR